MLLLLDESGDTGLKIGAGSSDWLVIAAVLFESREIGDRYETELRNMREQLGGREFHFAKDDDERRKVVLNRLREFEFEYHAVACNKTKLNINTWRKPQHLLFAVVDRLIERLAPKLSKCTLRFDTIGGTQDNSAYGKHIVKRVGILDGSPRVVHHKAVVSDSFPLCQLVDYVCGALTRSVKQLKKDADVYRELLKNREGKIIFWP
jgi:hypothetical protein